MRLFRIASNEVFSRKIGRRHQHSFVPPVFKHHVDCIGKADFYARLPRNNDENKRSSLDLLKVYEKVIGVPADEAEKMLQLTSTDDGWTKRLETWKGIQRGKDVFLRGLGSFNIPEIYEKRSRQLYNDFAASILFTVKSPHLKKAYKEIIKNYYLPKSPSPKTDDIRKWLETCPTTDLIEIFASSSMNNFGDVLKKTGFCVTEDLPCPSFPPFVDYEEVYYKGRDYYKKTLNRNVLMHCLYSGELTTVTRIDTGIRERLTEVDSTPFWLVPVHELQAFGHFSNALDGNTPDDAKRLFQYLNRVLERYDADPFKRHLIRHSDYWNDPDNIGSIDVLVRAGIHWPDGRDDMRPSHLLNRLREAERAGPNVQYTYLKDLQDMGSLRVLRSSHDVAWVADKLKNCASSLSHDVEWKRMVLVVLLNSSEKPIALGSHPLKGTWNEHGWSEIREVMNRIPSEETLKAFYDYNRTFREWHKTVFVPANEVGCP